MATGHQPRAPNGYLTRCPARPPDSLREVPPYAAKFTLPRSDLVRNEEELNQEA